MYNEELTKCREDLPYFAENYLDIKLKQYQKKLLNYFNINRRKNEMKKRALKTGMLVEDRLGRRGIVMLSMGYGNNDAIVGNGGSRHVFGGLEEYSENLKSIKKIKVPTKSWELIYPIPTTTNPDYDIMKVYSFSNNRNALSLSTDDRNLLWERKETKKIEVVVKVDGKSNTEIEFDVDNDIDIADVVGIDVKSLAEKYNITYK